MHSFRSIFILLSFKDEKNWYLDDNIEGIYFVEHCVEWLFVLQPFKHWIIATWQVNVSSTQNGYLTMLTPHATLGSCC